MFFKCFFVKVKKHVFFMFFIRKSMFLSSMVLLMYFMLFCSIVYTKWVKWRHYVRGWRLAWIIYNHGSTEYRGIFPRYLPWRKISGTAQHYKWTQHNRPIHITERVHKRRVFIVVVTYLRILFPTQLYKSNTCDNMLEERQGYNGTYSRPQKRKKNTKLTELTAQE